MIGRIPIQDIHPVVDCGRRPAKAAAGETFQISATVFREGHDAVAAGVVLTDPGRHARPAAAPCASSRPGTDRWAVDVSLPTEGHVALPGRGVGRPHRHLAARRGHQDPARHGRRPDVRGGRPAVRARGAGRTAGPSAPAERTRTGGGAAHRRRAAGGRRRGCATSAVDPRARFAVRSCPRSAATAAPRTRCATWSPRSARHRIMVDRRRALFGSWYEFFPRSEGAIVERGRGAQVRKFRDRGQAAARDRRDGLRRRLPAADPPDRAHLPQGPQQHPAPPSRTTRARRGRSAPRTAGTTRSTPTWARSTTSTRSSPGPASWAWRSRSTSPCSAPPTTRGSRSTRSGSPSGPTARSRTRRTRRRSTRTSTRSTSTRTPRASTPRSSGSCGYWMDHGVRIFRVDNPHTKPVAFWERLLADIHATDPDVLFLAEAFTRPAMMQTLAKIGFHQSYTYFTWRTPSSERRGVPHRARPRDVALPAAEPVRQHSGHSSRVPSARWVSRHSRSARCWRR